jgi:hypothetical protein
MDRIYNKKKYFASCIRHIKYVADLLAKASGDHSMLQKEFGNKYSNTSFAKLQTITPWLIKKYSFGVFLDPVKHP